MDGTVTLIVVLVIVVLVAVTLIRAVQIIPQATAAVIERLGRYKGTQPPGLTFLVPFVDRIRERIDLREQVVSFPPQPVITQDNLTVNIDTVVYFQVTDPRAAVYEISDYIVGVEQITTTTLRNVVGGMTLEGTLTSRDQINTQLRGELDEATGRWGIRVARVEIKAIDPPASIQESMERQMKADREKRATILTAEGQRESAIRSAEGQKQAQILTAEGAKQAAILNAEADRQSRILRAQGDRAARYLQAQGQAKAIEKVFAAIKAGKPTPELLAYQYLQTLPQMAQGDANKVWLVPSDFGKALEGFTRMLGAPGEDGVFRYQPSPDDGAPTNRPEDDDPGMDAWFDTRTNPEIAAVVANAEAQARREVPPLGAEPSAIPSAEAPPRLGPGAGPRQQRQAPSPAPRHEAPREIAPDDWNDEGHSSVPTPPRGTPAPGRDENQSGRSGDDDGSGLPGYPAPPPPR
ncbi:SPFH domain-containing protein [Pseudonocardia sp. N23]|uniref:SPFH domain-containing protein n=1 Tax=Pseudonocardia sp. N23 TaxID=1987376 RepID=UPI000BFC26DD|nr:SPFH domain-containing protein [Pseudonocardia sp. N23]GAY10673.1 putative stomatin/prohibitin-family membrane protease subunit YbbK [Pseudonocardia sp. N23]